MIPHFCQCGEQLQPGEDRCQPCRTVPLEPHAIVRDGRDVWPYIVQSGPWKPLPSVRCFDAPVTEDLRNGGSERNSMEVA